MAARDSLNLWKSRSMDSPRQGSRRSQNHPAHAETARGDIRAPALIPWAAIEHQRVCRVIVSHLLSSPRPLQQQQQQQLDYGAGGTLCMQVEQTSVGATVAHPHPSITTTCTVTLAGVFRQAPSGWRSRRRHKPREREPRWLSGFQRQRAGTLGERYPSRGEERKRKPTSGSR